MDLVVSDIAAPLESFAGEEIEVVWTVTNNGSDDATGTWIDGIYLTLDPANIQANEIYDVFIQHSQPVHKLAHSDAKQLCENG